jgi:hypothetical protein
MSTKRDYYAILGAKKDWSAEQLKKAYRKVAMKYHPDRNPGDKASEEKFKEAAEAYEVLSDGDKRATYDRYGHDGLKARPGQQSSADPFEEFFRKAGFSSADEFYAGTKGRASGGGGTKTEPPKDSPGHRRTPIRKGETVTFTEDTTIHSEIEDGATIIVEKAHVTVDGKMGDKITIRQTSKYPGQKSYTDGIKLNVDAGKECLFVAEEDIAAKNIGDKSKLKSKTTVRFVDGGNNLAVKGNSIFFNNAKNNLRADAQSGIYFKETGNEPNLSSGGNISGDKIGHQGVLTGVHITLKDAAGNNLTIQHDDKAGRRVRDTKITKAGKDARINADGKIEFTTFGDGARLNGTFVDGQNLGSDFDVKAKYNAKINDTGSRGHIEANEILVLRAGDQVHFVGSQVNVGNKGVGCIIEDDESRKAAEVLKRQQKTAPVTSVTTSSATTGAVNNGKNSNQPVVSSNGTNGGALTNSGDGKNSSAQQGNGKQIGSGANGLQQKSKGTVDKFIPEDISYEQIDGQPGPAGYLNDKKSGSGRGPTVLPGGKSRSAPKKKSTITIKKWMYIAGLAVGGAFLLWYAYNHIGKKIAYKFDKKTYDATKHMKDLGQFAVPGHKMDKNELPGGYGTVDTTLAYYNNYTPDLEDHKDGRHTQDKIDADGTLTYKPGSKELHIHEKGSGGLFGLFDFGAKDITIYGDPSDLQQVAEDAMAVKKENGDLVRKISIPSYRGAKGEDKYENNGYGYNGYTPESGKYVRKPNVK